MKFCLSAACSASKLQEADEILVPQGSSLDIIENLINLYPDKDIVFDCSGVPALALNDLNIISKNHLILAIHSPKDLGNYTGRWYFAEPCSSIYDAKFLKGLGSEYIVPEPPLFFNLPELKSTIDIKVRCNPTNATISSWGFVRPHNYHGAWIRPEDLADYENFIDIIEFSEKKFEREEKLYEIYKAREWKGTLDMIIPSLGSNARNPLIFPLGTTRLYCHQSCEKDTNCRFCDRAILLAEHEEEIIKAAKGEDYNG